MLFERDPLGVAPRRPLEGFPEGQAQVAGRARFPGHGFPRFGRRRTRQALHRRAGPFDRGRKQLAKTSQEATNARALEECRRVLEGDGHQPACSELQRRRSCTESDRSNFALGRIQGQEPRADAIQFERRQLEVLEGEERLHERGPRGVSRRGEFFDQGLQRGRAVFQAGEDARVRCVDRRRERTTRERLEPQRDRVHPQADEVLFVRTRAPGYRCTDDEVRLSRDAAEEGSVGGQQDDEGRRTARSRQLLHRSPQVGVDLEPLRGAGARALGGAWMVCRQLQSGRHAGEFRAPKGARLPGRWTRMLYALASRHAAQIECCGSWVDGFPPAGGAIERRQVADQDRQGESVRNQVVQDQHEHVLSIRSAQQHGAQEWSLLQVEGTAGELSKHERDFVRHAVGGTLRRR